MDIDEYNKQPVTNDLIDGNFVEAEHLSEQLKLNAGKKSGENRDAARDLNNLGAAYKDKGDLDQAIKCYSRANAIALTTFGPDHPDTKLYAASLADAIAARDAAK